VAISIPVGAELDSRKYEDEMPLDSYDPISPIDFVSGLAPCSGLLEHTGINSPCYTIPEIGYL